MLTFLGHEYVFETDTRGVPLTTASFCTDATRVISTCGQLGKLCGGRQNKLRTMIWDVETGECLRTFCSQQHGILRPVLSLDGSRVLSPSDGQPYKYDTFCTAKVWCVDSGKCLQVFQGTGIMNSAAFSPDESLVLTAGDNCVAQIWSTESGRLLRTLNTGGLPIANAIFSPDGGQVFAASLGSDFIVWDAKVGRRLQTCHDGSNGLIKSAIFSADGSKIRILFPYCGVAKVWSIETGDKCWRSELMACYKDRDTG